MCVCVCGGFNHQCEERTPSNHPCYVPINIMGLVCDCVCVCLCMAIVNIVILGAQRVCVCVCVCVCGGWVGVMRSSDMLKRPKRKERNG